MVEIGDHAVEEINQISLLPDAGLLELSDHTQEVVQLGAVVSRVVLDDAKGFKALHIKHFLVGEELFKVLLAGGVAIEEIARPFALGDQLFGTVARLVLGLALVGFVAKRGQVAHSDIGEGDQVKLLTELREEDVAVATQQAGHQAQLAGFLGSDEIAAHVARGRDRLALGKTLVETVQQAAVGERHVSKARGGDRQGLAGPHQEHFHDALAGAHHIDGVGSLVGRHAEILLGAELEGRFDGADGIEDVDIHHTHQSERVFLAAHVLERGKIEHIIIAAGPLDQGIVLRRATVDGEGAEITVDIA